MVVDIQKLSDALRSVSPEAELRHDLERLIGTHRAAINHALANGQSYWLRVPDGRQIRISRRIQPVNAAQ